MEGNVVVQQQPVGTGTWNLDAPISFFSVATYRRPNGKIVQMPVAVSGEKITGSLQPGTAGSQS